MSSKIRGAVAVLLLIASAAAFAQERFSLFVGSDPKVVERMVTLSALRNDDVVMDLGAGDGRIIFQALKTNPTVRGIGVDIDAKLVKQATATAESAGVANRVEFQHRNVFDADLSKVDVIYMWLFPELMRLLRVKILEEARPGTRVVANLWDMGTWPHDALDSDGPEVRMWIVPARVAGYWTWELPVGAVRRTYSTVLEQRFQTIEGVLRAGNRHGLLHDARLRADAISFTTSMTLEGLGFTRHEFSGRVRGDTIEGEVRITMPPRTKEEDEKLETFTLPWRATRTAKPDFLAPVGLNIR